MLSLSKKTDYALLALTHLSHTEAGRAVNTKEIAERYDIPTELLAKILQRLTRGGLIVSTPGPTGGYRLARPAAQISVGSVVALVDGPPAIIQCMKTVHNTCGQRDRCTIRQPLERINARILEMLDRMSLTEISQDERIETTIMIHSQRVPSRHDVSLPALHGGATRMEEKI